MEICWGKIQKNLGLLDNCCSWKTLWVVPLEMVRGLSFGMIHGVEILLCMIGLLIFCAWAVDRFCCFVLG